MKIFKIILYIVATLAAMAIFGYTYYGGFRTIQPSIRTCGGEVLVFEKVKGDYSQSEAVSDRVYDRLRKTFEIETQLGFGIYYDKPGTVPTHELKSDVGCILEPTDINRIADIQREYYVETFPTEPYLVVEFPFKGKASVLVGLMKVYPAIESYIKENNYQLDTPIMEIWDITNQKTIYRKKLLRQTGSLQ